ETTAAAAGQVGVVRRDPMAMLPFLGYHAGDYFAHWLSIGDQSPTGNGSNLPKVFYVNWFRRSPDGRFLWPGFGENSRVLAWIVDRLEGRSETVETPIGRVPAPGALDVDGLDLDPADVAQALAVDTAVWQAEADSIGEWFDRFGKQLP